MKMSAEYKLARWNALVNQKTVIPLEELPLNQEEFQSRVASALYNLSIQVYELKKKKKRIVEEPQEEVEEKETNIFSILHDGE